MYVRGLSRGLIVVITLLVACLACNYPGAVSELESDGWDRQSAVATRVAATIGHGSISEQVSTVGANPPSDPDILSPPTTPPTVLLPPTITQTPTATNTPAPSVPMLSVSVNTNCRYGPGMVYKYLGALVEGEVAQIFGRDPADNFWYIENPDQPGGFCWVTAAYAQVNGDTSQVPVLTPPPTPTPSPTPTNTVVPVSFNVGGVLASQCSGQSYITLRIDNTGSVPIDSYAIGVKDLDTGVNIFRSGNGFLVGPSCQMQINDVVPPGGNGYIFIGPFSYMTAGHQMQLAVKICTENSQGGSCIDKSYTQVAAGLASDVALKENRAAVDERLVLERLLEIPIETWNYIDDPNAIRHMGPMAQDFFAAYELGADDRLSAIDVQGVALASIQALHEIVEEKDGQIAELEARLTELETHAATEVPAADPYLDLAVGFLASVSLVLAVGWIWRRRRLHDM